MSHQPSLDLIKYEGILQRFVIDKITSDRFKDYTFCVIFWDHKTNQVDIVFDKLRNLTDKYVLDETDLFVVSRPESQGCRVCIDVESLFKILPYRPKTEKYNVPIEVGENEIRFKLK